MIICIYDVTEYGSCMIDDVLFDMLEDYNFDMFYDYSFERKLHLLNKPSALCKLSFVQ